MNSCGRQDAPAIERAAQFKEHLVDLSETLEADATASELMHPGNRAFYHPAGLVQSAAMLGVAHAIYQLVSRSLCHPLKARAEPQ